MKAVSGILAAFVANLFLIALDESVRLREMPIIGKNVSSLCDSLGQGYTPFL
jgi:hypothetical protein